jgi:hypothetical protein
MSMADADYIDVQTDALETAIRARDVDATEAILSHMRAEGAADMDLFTSLHVAVDRVHHSDPELEREADG